MVLEKEIGQGIHSAGRAGLQWKKGYFFHVTEGKERSVQICEQKTPAQEPARSRRLGSKQELHSTPHHRMCVPGKPWKRLQLAPLSWLVRTWEEEEKEEKEGESLIGSQRGGAWSVQADDFRNNLLKKGIKYYFSGLQQMRFHVTEWSEITSDNRWHLRENWHLLVIQDLSVLRFALCVAYDEDTKKSYRVSVLQVIIDIKYVAFQYSSTEQKIYLIIVSYCRHPLVSTVGQTTLQSTFPHDFVPYNTSCLVVILQLRKQDRRGKVNCS